MYYTHKVYLVHTVMGQKAHLEVAAGKWRRTFIVLLSIPWANFGLICTAHTSCLNKEECFELARLGQQKPSQPRYVRHFSILNIFVDESLLFH